MYGLCISLVLGAAVYTDAAVALFKAQGKPLELANQEGCYLEHLNKVIPYGDYYPERSCYKYTCDSDNITQLSSCGVVKIDKRCQLVSNEEADYPDCCPYEMCGTISPEFLPGPPDSTEEYNETPPDTEEYEIKKTGPPVSDQSTEEGRIYPAVFKVSGETVESGASELKLLDQKIQFNELLIAQANSNLGG